MALRIEITVTVEEDPNNPGTVNAGITMLNVGHEGGVHRAEVDIVSASKPFLEQAMQDGVAKWQEDNRKSQAGIIIPTLTPEQMRKLKGG